MSLDNIDVLVEVVSVVTSSECPRVAPLMLVIPARTLFLHIVLVCNEIACRCVWLFCGISGFLMRLIALWLSIYNVIGTSLTSNNSLTKVFIQAIFLAVWYAAMYSASVVDMQQRVASANSMRSSPKLILGHIPSSIFVFPDPQPNLRRYADSSFLWPHLNLSPWLIVPFKYFSIRFTAFHCITGFSKYRLA